MIWNLNRQFLFKFWNSAKKAQHQHLTALAEIQLKNSHHRRMTSANVPSEAKHTFPLPPRREAARASSSPVLFCLCSVLSFFIEVYLSVLFSRATTPLILHYYYFAQLFSLRTSSVFHPQQQQRQHFSSTTQTCLFYDSLVCLHSIPGSHFVVCCSFLV